MRQAQPAFAVALLSLFIPPACAASAADLDAIRSEIRNLKAQYEARIDALERRLREAEVQARAAAAAARSTAAPAGPAPTSTAAAATPAPTPQPAASAGIAAFNPAISLLLQGTYGYLRRDPSRYALAGFAQADEVESGRRGFGLGETELSLSANIDDRFSGNVVLALAPDNSVAVEEAYGTLQATDIGIVPRFGRFRSGIGYLNEQHQHTWDFRDAPLAYQAFLNGGLVNDGVQVKWVAPLDQFVEVGAEFASGDAFPGSARGRNGIGTSAAYVHVGGDLGTSHSFRAGLSFLRTSAQDRSAMQLDTSGSLADVSFTGTSRMAIADFVWKYAPGGNARDQSFKLQGEYLWRRERGSLVYDPAGAMGLTQEDRYAGTQAGWYLQGVWQFRPSWRVGMRYDRLDPRVPDYGVNADLLAVTGIRPSRATVMFDYTPSEFSRFRVQYARSSTRPDETDHQLFLQYILSLGAHGAHRY